MKHDFSKDLLDTVKAVMSEKKLDPVNKDELKGTHAQRKDKDIDNDGDVDASDEYLHKRRKAVKKAVETNEDHVEEGYVSAAQRKAVWASRADGGKGHPDKKKKKSTNEQFTDLVSEGSMPTADEPTEENKKTAEKVRALLAKEKKPIKPIKLTKGWGDGGKSMKSSYGKMTKEEQEFIDSLNDEMFEEADYLETDLKKRKKNNDKAIKDMKKMGSPMKNPAFGEEVEQIDEISGKTLASYSDKVARYGPMKDAKTREKHEKGIYTAYKKMKGKDVKVPARMEEVEQIDEISTKLAHNYYNKSYSDYWKQDTKGKAKRRKGMDTAHLKMKGDDEFSGRKAKVPASGIKYGAESYEMTEARGRPRKENKDYTIHPKTKEKLMHNNPAHMKRIENLQRTGALPKPKTEAGQNIITQLRKASTSMTGGHKVNFTHGASTTVTADHARKLLDKHADMKPHEKESFQKDIGHSYARLRKHT